MPYAPGVTYRAGEYFAAAGQRINENIQNYLRNREERQQTTSTAEMLGRYLGQDPKAMEMFGDKLAQVPNMSTGAAKGVIGGVATYLSQRHLKAVEDSQKQSFDLSRQQYDLQAGEAARRLAAEQKIGQFNQGVREAFGSDGSGVTADTLARIAAQSGVLGEPGINSLITAAQNYGQKPKGMAAGDVVRTSDGLMVVGKGEGFSPEVLQPKAAETPKGLDFGVVQETPAGSLVGVGLQNEPKFLAKPDKSKLDPTALQRAQALSTFGQQLDAAEQAVNTFGADWIRSAEGSATLKQLPSLLATGYYKATDPSSIVSQKEVDKFTEDLFPQGKFTRVAVTKAALENLRKLTAMHSISWSAAHGGEVPGLPESITKHVKGAAPGGPSTASADEVAVISPDGRRGRMRKDKLEEALKNGFKLAQ